MDYSIHLCVHCGEKTTGKYCKRCFRKINIIMPEEKLEELKPEETEKVIDEAFKDGTPAKEPIPEQKGEPVDPPDEEPKEEEPKE